jgi:hypothetical protein
MRKRLHPCRIAWLRKTVYEIAKGVLVFKKATRKLKPFIRKPFNMGERTKFADFVV